MSLSQWELENEWIKLLSYIGEHYDDVRAMLQHNNVLAMRNECSAHGLEFTPQEVVDCLQIVRLAYETVSAQIEQERFNDEK